MQDYQLITIVGANLAVFIGFLGSTVALIIYGNKKADAQIKAIYDEMRDFHNDMRGFHGRLVAIETKGQGETS